MWSHIFYSSDFSKLIKLSTIFILYFIAIQYYTNDIFEFSSQKLTKEINKINSQDSFDGNIRVNSGPLLFSTLNTTELLFGLRSSSVDEYVNNSTDSSLALLKIENSVFLPSFWLIWASYGIVGLILYLYLYIYFYKKSKKVAPLMLILFFGMFIQKIGIGPVYIFYIIFLILETNYTNINSKLIQ